VAFICFTGEYWIIGFTVRVPSVNRYVFALLAGQDLYPSICWLEVCCSVRVFMATDPVTSPHPRRWDAGSSVLVYGVIIMVIRLWGGYPEGVTFAILFMNAVTPLLNRWTRPANLWTWGEGK